LSHVLEVGIGERKRGNERREDWKNGMME